MKLRMKKTDTGSLFVLCIFLVHHFNFMLAVFQLGPVLLSKRSTLLCDILMGLHVCVVSALVTLQQSFTLHKHKATQRYPNEVL